MMYKRDRVICVRACVRLSVCVYLRDCVCVSTWVVSMVVCVACVSVREGSAERERERERERESHVRVHMCGDNGCVCVYLCLRGVSVGRKRSLPPIFFLLRSACVTSRGLCADSGRFERLWL